MLVRSPNSRIGIRIDARMIIPPMVGVPRFWSCPSRPRLRISLADLAALQHADDPFAEDHADHQREDNAHRGPERQREEHARAGNIEMQ